MNIKISEKSEFLYVVTTGKFSLEEAKSTFLEILDAIARRHEKVIFDGLEIVGNPTTIQRFYYGEFVADAVTEFTKRNGLAAPQFAYVLNKPVLDPLRLGETVARNRRMNVKTFDNLEEALRWLGLGSVE